MKTTISDYYSLRENISENIEKKLLEGNKVFEQIKGGGLKGEFGEFCESLIDTLFLTRRYINAAFWENVGRPTLPEDYIAMKKSGIIDKVHGSPIEFRYNLELSPTENLKAAKVLWAGKAGEIIKYTKRLADLHHTFGVEIHSL